MEDSYNIEEVARDEEALSKRLDHEADLVGKDGMKALSDWKRSEAMKHRQIATWLRELKEKR